MGHSYKKAPSIKHQNNKLLFKKIYGTNIKMPYMTISAKKEFEKAIKREFEKNNKL